MFLFAFYFILLISCQNLFSRALHYFHWSSTNQNFIDFSVRVSKVVFSIILITVPVMMAIVAFVPIVMATVPFAIFVLEFLLCVNNQSNQNFKKVSVSRVTVLRGVIK